MKPVTGKLLRTSKWREKVAHPKGGGSPIGGIGIQIAEGGNIDTWYNSVLMTEKDSVGYFTGYEEGDEVIINLKANGEHINFTEVYPAEAPPLSEGSDNTPGESGKHIKQLEPPQSYKAPKFLDITREPTEEELQLTYDNLYEIGLRCVKAARGALKDGAVNEWKNATFEQRLHEARKMADTMLINVLGGKRR